MSEDTNSLLLVDDDDVFCQVLARALNKRGMQTTIAHNADIALSITKNNKTAYAIVDLRMPESSGLELISSLLIINPAMRIIVLTGYASITTAVEAIKLGAIHYLTKPTDADVIMSAFNSESGNIDTKIRDKPLSVDRLQWEHIQKVLNDCKGNISAAARQLGMHRRTLQRKLKKRPVNFH